MDDIYKNIEDYNLNKKPKNIACISRYDCLYA